ncbi:multidrug export protein MepA [Clostridiales bacterium]|nr:multidrug export protein MepA [Clostridiales bacterium]
MEHNINADSFGTERIWKILLRIAPPVMLAQLIQALYNVVDSYFIGKFSEDGLTALSVIFPIQVLIIALAVGTGVGVNTLMARMYAQDRESDAGRTAGVGIFLAVVTWAVFAILTALILRPFVMTSAKSPEAVEYAVSYGRIVCAGSLGIFLESCFSKIHQAMGNMKLPMLAQISGAVTNIILDPILIFGVGKIPAMGVTGAAIATICGQFVAAVITGVSAARRPPKLAKMSRYIRAIYHYGFPSIFMQVLYVVYIMILNIILSGFSDAAVTVLGLYYKLQSFFFIPLQALETCIVPVLSYNYARGRYDRCRSLIWNSVLLSMGFMLVGVFCFEIIPESLIGIFSESEAVLTAGVPAFRIIGSSFIPATVALLSPTIFQAIGEAHQSIILSLIRQVFCLIPIFWFFSNFGLVYTWIAFPMAEIITSTVGLCLYFKETRRWNVVGETKSID